MALMTRYSNMAARPHCHCVVIPQLPRGKLHPETRVKICARSNGWIKHYGSFDPLLKVGRPDLLVTEKQFRSYPQKKLHPETRVKV